MSTEAEELLERGGAWLAAVRAYIQRAIPGGNVVTWSSARPMTVTVRQLQMAGAVGAAAVMNERQALVRSQSEVDAVLNLAADHIDGKAKFPGKRYEEGLTEMYRWLVGETDENPMAD